MTAKTIVESVRQIFPTIGSTQILKEIDLVQKEFADETEILTASAELTSPSTNTVWALNSSIKSIYNIEAYDSNSLPVELDDVNLTYNIEFGQITFIDTTGVVITGLPTGINSIYVSYYKIPASITAETDSLEIPEQFHEGILARVFERFYSRFPIDMVVQGQIVKAVDWNAVKYWNGVYTEIRIKAKKYKNINRDSMDASYTVDWAGYPNIIKRTKYLGAGIMLPLSSAYTKYLRVTATSPNTVTVNTSFGFTSTITASIVGGVINIGSTAEFTPTMFVVNNQNANYAYSSTSLITVSPAANWGTIVIEIYER